MLRELHLQNLAVLAGAEVELGPGFNVLTGETGAGKSIVLDAVALLAGGRARSDLIRSGASSLSVAGVFEPVGTRWRAVLEEAGLEAEADGLLLVRREINREGRNRVFVNDQPATIKLLVEIAPFLLRLHGQREELGLVAPDLQRTWLDRSGIEKGGEALVTSVREAYECWRRLEERRERAAGDQRLWQERLDLIRFQLSEIDAAKLRQGEDRELAAERAVLRNVEAITGALAASVANLSEDEGAVLERLAQTRHRLDDIAEWDAAAKDWAVEVEELRIRVSELASSVQHRLDSVEADPRRLDVVEDRLAVIERLSRKYGGDAAAVLERRAELERERDTLEGDAMTGEELQAATEQARETYRQAANDLTTARQGWGKDLARRVVEELKDLSLPKAVFSVSLEPRPPGPHGSDQVTFLFSPNPGETPRPLGRVASGGELSRVYLALQLAAGLDHSGVGMPTLIFDEIDAGLGGAEGFALGQKLRRLASSGQVLAVTHLPQVASQGDVHFQVSKRVEGERTLAKVARLSPDERIEETARMLSGAKVTESSLSHARELLASSRASG